MWKWSPSTIPLSVRMMSPCRSRGDPDTSRPRRTPNSGRSHRPSPKPYSRQWPQWTTRLPSSIWGRGARVEPHAHNLSLNRATPRRLNFPQRPVCKGFCVVLVVAPDGDFQVSAIFLQQSKKWLKCVILPLFSPGNRTLSHHGLRRFSSFSDCCFALLD